jgi:hypothetical protein
MSERTMRAKMQVGSVTPYHDNEGNVTQENVKFHGVAKSSPYPEDGSDEDNSFARWSPSVSLDITIANPNLFGQLKAGDKFYVDFTRAAA